MSRKTTAAIIAALGINFALAGGALMLANLNKPAAFDLDEAFATSASDIQVVAGSSVDASAGDLAVPLKAAQQGGNTRVTFTCGKAVPSGREVHEGTWDQIRGAVLYRPKAQQLLAIEAVFDTRSLRTDAQGLTNTVTSEEKWFDIDNHPLATFTCDTIEPVDPATPSHTHNLIGSFTLNGITQPITIPARLTFSGQSLTLDADFTILRSDFDVAKRASSLAGTLGGVTSTVEDEVKMTVRVTASPDTSAVLNELAQLIQHQQEQLRIAAVERERLMSLAARIELLEEKTSRLANAAPNNQPAVDLASLPKQYTDHALGNDGQHPFDMRLIPGDPAQGIAPFYLATHEVQWGMMDRWMYAGDLDDKPIEHVAKLRKQGLRPSPLYEEPAQLIQVQESNVPAMAMSRKTAVAYCKWLSEQTGRTYRLPTMDEWKHAMRLGGGMPQDLDAHAWHLGNEQYDDFGRPKAMPAGTKKPNAIGLYDMFGSVAEWVVGTGTNRVIVGGSFRTPPDEFSEDWQMIEKIDVWSASYPQRPYSEYWYSDVYYTGIRLVCEPASVAANPPAKQ